VEVIDGCEVELRAYSTGRRNVVGIRMIHSTDVYYLFSDRFLVPPRFEYIAHFFKKIMKNQSAVINKFVAGVQSYMVRVWLFCLHDSHNGREIGSLVPDSRQSFY
jgi:hypothetical protein